MADKKRAKKVDRREFREIRDLGKENFDQYVGRYSDKRLFLRLVHRRKIKPCGRGCRDYGYLIASEFSNHSSFENFPELMNDEEFLLEIARISRNPAECPIYFYDYVNEYLKRNKEFRLKFLKAIYLNDNVYKLEDINTIIEYLGMKKENDIILDDIDFKKVMKERLNSIDYRELLEYDCSGLSKKELRDYKIKANEMKILCENKKRGLTEIVNSFTVGQEEKLKYKEPETYYEFLLMQGRKTT